MTNHKTYRAEGSARPRLRVAASLALLFGVLAPAIVLSGPRAAVAGEVGALPAGIGACVSCHTMDSALSHPLLVAPSRGAPARLPLDAGRMTCLTCHDQDKAQGHDSRGTQGESYLRGAETAGGLCIQCHTGGPDAASAHAAGLGRAHLLRGSRRSGPHQAGRLDEESKACVGCHDGSTASDAGSHALPFSPGGDPSDHPIGVLVNAKTQREDCGIRSSQAIDTRVRLYNNAIGCGSCHNVYSDQKDLLVISNQRSALCLSCHVQ